MYHGNILKRLPDDKLEEVARETWIFIMSQKMYKEEILEYIKKEPGLTFRQLKFRLEMNESTLNRNLNNLIKLKFIRKSKDKRYFFNKNG